MPTTPPQPSQPETIANRNAARGGIDPRGPRFGASITALVLLIVVFLGILGQDSPALYAIALGLLIAQAALFAWGAFAGIRKHPFGLFFARFIRPRLAPPTELEDPAAPSFAQGVGLLVVGTGVVLALFSVPLAVPLAAGAAFIAAFLNAVFGFCLGCELYLLLLRARILRPS